MSSAPVNVAQWRPDEYPLLTRRIYQKQVGGQAARCLINRGCFKAVDLTDGMTDSDFRHRVSGRVVVWDGYEGYGSVMDMRLGPTDDRVRLNLSSPTGVNYKTVERGCEIEIPNRLEEVSQFVPKADILAGVKIRATHDLQREQRIASLIEDSGTSTTLALGGYGKIGTKADVVGHLTSVLDGVDDANPVGQRPDLLVLGVNVARTVRDMPQARGIEGAIAAGALGAPMAAERARSLSNVEAWLSTMLADELGTDMKVRVGSARINTAAKGQAASPSYIWDPDSIYLLWDGAERTMTDGVQAAEGELTVSGPTSVICIDAGRLNTGRWEKPNKRGYFVYGDRRDAEFLLDQSFAYHYSEAV